MDTDIGQSLTTEAYKEAVKKPKKFEAILQHVSEDYTSLKIKFEMQNQQLAEQKLQLDELIQQNSAQSAQMEKIIDQNSELLSKLSREDSEKKKKKSSKKKHQGCDEPTKMDLDRIIESNWEEIVDNFDNMNLKAELLRGIYFNGLETPSAIQQRAIIPCVQGHDVIVQAQSSTGRINTFSMSILQQIDTSVSECQALVLTPTRELPPEIQKVVIALGGFLSVKCVTCVGGTKIRENKKEVEKGHHVVVGTPGRILDVMQRGALRPSQIRMFVLEEADKMLSRDFKDQTSDIFKTLNDDVQVIISSATLPPIVPLLDFNRKFKLISINESAPLE